MGEVGELGGRVQKRGEMGDEVVVVGEEQVVPVEEREGFGVAVAVRFESWC